MSQKHSLIFRYLVLSVFFYGLVIQIVSVLSDFISPAPFAIGFSFLAIYGLDFTFTSVFVFKSKLTTSSLIRFLAVTLFFFLAVLMLSRLYLVLTDYLPIATILTGLTLAPFRFLISKNYVFNPSNYLQGAIKDSIGQVSRGISTVIRFFDRENRFEKASKHTSLNYLKSLLGFQNSTLLMNLDLPWWPFSAIKYIEGKLRDQQFKVFEWGSGASTVWLSRRVQSVVSVEHDVGWANTVNLELSKRELRNVSLCSIPPQNSDTPRIPSGKSGFLNLDFSNYVDSITKFGNFDLIVIDGRARVDCWKQACVHLKQGGYIVFDNYNRSRYQIDTKGFRVVFFSGLTPASVWPTHTMIAEKL